MSGYGCEGPGLCEWCDADDRAREALAKDERVCERPRCRHAEGDHDAETHRCRVAGCPCAHGRSPEGLWGTFEGEPRPRMSRPRRAVSWTVEAITAGPACDALPMQWIPCGCSACTMRRGFGFDADLAPWSRERRIYGTQGRLIGDLNAGRTDGVQVYRHDGARTTPPRVAVALYPAGLAWRVA